MEKHIGIVVIGVAALLVGVGVLKLSSKIAMFLIPTSTKDQKDIKDQKDPTPGPIQDVDIEACIEVKTHIEQVCDEDVQVTEPVAEVLSLPEKTSEETNDGPEETKSAKPKKKKVPPKTHPNRGSTGRSETTPPKEEAATGKVGRKR